MQKLLKIICVSLVFALINFSLFSQSVVQNSAQSQNTKIRVGYVERKNFCEGSGDNEYKTGYAYEYLQRVANFTGWSYEYIYGDWDEMIEMLEKGQIDIMPGVSKTPDRVAFMSFPDYSMGNESYYIYIKSNQYYVENGLDELKGKVIGTTGKSTRTLFLNQWVREHNGLCEVKLYSGNETLYAAVESGEISALASTNNIILPIDGMVPVEKIGESEYYLAVSKNRPDLLTVLNNKLEILNATSPYFLEQLQGKYYSATKTTPTFTDEEMEWLDTHSALRIGYISSYMPFCEKDKNGKPRGMLVDVVDKMMSNLSLNNKLEKVYVDFCSQEDMMTALKTGNVDIVFPVVYDLYNAEKNGIHLSKEIVKSTAVFAFEGVYSQKSSEVLAVNQYDEIQENYVKNFYSSSEIVYCDSSEACIELVNSGNATGTVINGYTKNSILAKRNLNLNIVELPEPCIISFGLNRNETGLVLLINRCLESLEESYALDSIYKYESEINVITFYDFIQRYLWIIITSILVFLILIILLVSIAYVKERKHIAIQKTQKKELEQALQSAADANRAKSAFLFNMSHDIRTPMNAIIGYTDLLRNHLGDRILADSYLEKIQSSNSFLLRILNNVLEMARIDSGKLTNEEKYVDLLVFIEAFISLFEEQMKNKEIEFTNHVDIIHKDVMLDETKISEIFLNIVGNALKYTNNGGKVHFEIREINSDNPDYAVYKTLISDTGIGMSQDYIPHIFDEFSRERTSTESKVVGTGLGMAIVQRFVNFLNGTISVESIKGNGTTFTIVLPLRIAVGDEIIKHEKKEKPVIDKKSVIGKRILLAEDNELNAEIATTILTEFGMQCDVAENGKVCVRMLQESSDDYYDLILMDIQMPEMDGYAATTKIRGLDNQKKNSIPIIAMTANAFAEDKRHALEVGMNGHLGKPIMPTELLNTIATQFSKT